MIARFNTEEQEQPGHQVQEEYQQPKIATPSLKLPRHLRDKWFVNPELQTSPTTCALYSIPPEYTFTYPGNQSTPFPCQGYATQVINPTQMTFPGASIAQYRTAVPPQGYYRTCAGLPHNPAWDGHSFGFKLGRSFFGSVRLVYIAGRNRTRSCQLAKKASHLAH